MPLDGFEKVEGMTARAASKIDAVKNGIKRNHVGRDKAVKSAKIEDGLGLSGPEIRSIISHLRVGDRSQAREPEPICSNGSGYFYAENADELTETISHISQRIRQLERVRDGLMRAGRIMSGAIPAIRQAEIKSE